MKCSVCDRGFIFSWTDTHGIGQCVGCGSPWRIYHYDANKQRVDKEPELILDSANAASVRRFHAETGCRVSAVGMGLSFPGGYDIASKDDLESGEAWFAANCACPGAI